MTAKENARDNTVRTFVPVERVALMEALVSLVELPDPDRALLDQFEDIMGDGGLRSASPRLQADLDWLEFDSENTDYDGTDWATPLRGLLGFQCIDALNFFGICSGGDWEVPVYYILYHDGVHVRGYIPHEGNPYNDDVNRAYGNVENIGEFDDNGKWIAQPDADVLNARKRFPAGMHNQNVTEGNDLSWERLVNPADIRADIVKNIQQGVAAPPPSKHERSLTYLLENRHTRYLEWVEPHPASGPEGNDLTAHVTLRATVHDCVNMSRLQARAAGRPTQGGDADHLSNFIAINWAEIVKETR